MKTNIIYWLLCACLCGNFSGKGQAARGNNADSLMLACIEYEKAVYAAPTDSVRNIFLFKKALCQKKMASYKAEEKTLLRIDPLVCNDSMMCAVYYERALCHYLLAKFKEAANVLERAYSIPLNTPEYNACLLLHGFVLNELNQYGAAKEKLIEYFKVKNGGSAQKELAAIDSLYLPENVPHLKSLRKAKRMSTFLPGLGLFYAKEPGKAVVNITLLLASATYTAHNVVIANYFTAITSGTYFLRYFYVGGINQLNDAIPKYNYKRTRVFNTFVKTRIIALL